MNLALIDTDDPKQRAQITDAIYHTELSVDSTSLEGQTATRPIDLAEFQRDLNDSDLVVEYVVAEPQSQALAITKTTVHPYTPAWPGHARSAMPAGTPRSIPALKALIPLLGQKLFDGLVRTHHTELREKSHLILIPDGSLHLLPFSALDEPQPVSSTRLTKSA